MGIRTLIWSGFFFGTCVAALFNPIWGVIGYMGHYTVGPENQWWAAPINHLGLRYSFTLALCTGIGILLHRTGTSFREGLLHSQQKLILVFLAIVWASTLLSVDTVGRYQSIDHPSVKLTKIIFFCFMLCHIAGNLKDLTRVIWILTVGTFVLGQEAYELPRSSFRSGRLDSVGGPDFSESNFLAAFIVGVLPIIGFQFLRSGGLGKLTCAVSGVFATNALVLTRSRGAFLGLALTGAVSVLYAPKYLRKKIYAGLILAVLGGLYLADEQFLNRMTSITSSGEERDASANQRLEVWSAGLRIISNNPFGIGTGNWYQTIGDYDPRHFERDSHSTYIKLAAEQGILGLAVFGAIVLNGLLTLRRVRIRSELLPPASFRDFQYLSTGFTLSLIGFLLCCGLITLSYMEATWWFLVLPVCLERSLHRVESEIEEGEHPYEGDDATDDFAASDEFDPPFASTI